VSQEPLLSPIIWTTIATGKAMDQHGVLDFWAVNPESGRMIQVSGVERKVEAVWDILGRFDRDVGVVGWLASWWMGVPIGLILAPLGLFHRDARRMLKESLAA